MTTRLALGALVLVCFGVRRLLRWVDESIMAGARIHHVG